MASKNLYFMKKALLESGINVTDSMTVNEIKNLFDNLPITKGQIRELKLFDITYNPDWKWTRGYASNFIKESTAYIKLRNSLPISPIQRIVLMEHGIEITEKMTAGEAANIIYNLPADQEQIDYIKKFDITYNTDSTLTYGYAQQLIKKYERRVHDLKLKKS